MIGRLFNWWLDNLERGIKASITVVEAIAPPPVWPSCQMDGCRAEADTKVGPEGGRIFACFPHARAYLGAFPEDNELAER